MPLKETTVYDIMTPQESVEYIDISLPLDKQLLKVNSSSHSKLLVLHHNFADIRGFITKQKAQKLLSGKHPIINEISNITFVDHDTSLLNVLIHFGTNKDVMIGIKDPFGDFEGIIVYSNTITEVNDQILKIMENL